MHRRTYLKLSDSSRPIINRLDELWNFSESEMRGKDFQINGDLRLIILSQITGVASRTVHAVLTQVKNNSFYGVDFLLRPLVEGLINYKYIKEDDTQMRARAFIADDLRSKLANVRRLIPLLENNQAPAMSTVTNAEKYRELELRLTQEQNELIELYGKENITFPSLEERARQSNTSEIYATSYWLLCQDSHLTPTGLDRYMREEDGQLKVIWDLNLERFNMSIRTFYIIFSALLSESNEKFGIPQKEGLDGFEAIP